MDFISGSDISAADMRKISKQCFLSSSTTEFSDEFFHNGSSMKGYTHGAESREAFDINSFFNNEK